MAPSRSPTPDAARPAPKRIRSDRDHSKGDTKDKEAKHHADGDDDKKDGEEDEKNEDDDWISKPPFCVGQDKKGFEVKWRESCWCGKTAFVFNSDPLQTKMCHCEDCQRLHGAPCQHVSVFKKEAVRLDSSPKYLGFLSAHGEVHPLSDTPTPLPHKISCRACGSPLMDQGRNMIMAFPPCFEFARTHKEADAGKEGGGKDEKRKGGKKGLPEVFKPQCHIFYERRVIDFADGTTKWRGLDHDKSEKMGEHDE